MTIQTDARLMTDDERDMLRAQLMKTNYARKMNAEDFETWFSKHAMKPMRHVEKADDVTRGIVRSVLVEPRASDVSAERIAELMQTTARRSGIYDCKEFESSSWYRTAQLIAHSRALRTQYENDLLE